MKPGIKTTEFWITVVSQVIGILTLLGVLEPSQATVLSDSVSQIVGGLIMAFSALGYSISRGQAKKGG